MIELMYCRRYFCISSAPPLSSVPIPARQSPSLAPTETTTGYSQTTADPPAYKYSMFDRSPFSDHSSVSTNGGAFTEVSGAVDAFSLVGSVALGLDVMVFVVVGTISFCCGFVTDA